MDANAAQPNPTPVDQPLVSYQQPQQSDAQRVKDWLHRTDHTLGRGLDFLRQKLDFEPMFTTMFAVFFLLFWMITDPKRAHVAHQIICIWTYPFVESVVALHFRDHDGLRIWCVYFFVYTFLGLLDVLADLKLAYWPAKTILCVYLFLPPTQYIGWIYDAWLMPVIELVYGELHIETLRRAHPYVMRSLGLNREKAKDWNQEQLRVYLAQCQAMVFLFTIRLHQILADSFVDENRPEPVRIDIPLD